jgi:hypothetical protein
MRMFAPVLALLTLCGPTRSQDIASDPEVMIRRVIETGRMDGHVNKQLCWMGDAAAVHIVKIVGGRNLTGQEASSVLDILWIAFTAPKLVENPPDREPGATLFVLRYLALDTTDPGLKRRIEEERTHMEGLAVTPSK